VGSANSLDCPDQKHDGCKGDDGEETASYKVYHDAYGKDEERPQKSQPRLKLNCYAIGLIAKANSKACFLERLDRRAERVVQDLPTGREARSGRLSAALR